MSRRSPRSLGGRYPFFVRLLHSLLRAGLSWRTDCHFDSRFPLNLSHAANLNRAQSRCSVCHWGGQPDITGIHSTMSQFGLRKRSRRSGALSLSSGRRVRADRLAVDLQQIATCGRPDHLRHLGQASLPESGKQLAVPSEQGDMLRQSILVAHAMDQRGIPASSRIRLETT